MFTLSPVNMAQKLDSIRHTRIHSPKVTAKLLCIETANSRFAISKSNKPMSLNELLIYRDSA